MVVYLSSSMCGMYQKMYDISNKSNSYSVHWILMDREFSNKSLKRLWIKPKVGGVGVFVGDTLEGLDLEYPVGLPGVLY